MSGVPTDPSSGSRHYSTYPGSDAAGSTSPYDAGVTPARPDGPGDDPADGPDDAPAASAAGSTGLRSRRVATVAAVAGVLALVVGSRQPAVALAAVGGVVTGGALSRLHGSDRTAAAARALAAAGLLAGVAGTGLALATPALGWPVPPVALLAVACWTAVVAAVLAGAPDDVGRRCGTVGGAAFVAAAFLGAAAVLVGGQGSVGSTAGAFARALWAPAAWVVAGPARSGLSIPFVAFLITVLAVAVLGALSLLPRHVVLSPRATSEDVAHLGELRGQIARVGLVAGLVAFLTFSLDVRPIPLGSLAPLGTLLRAALLAGILVASFGAVAGFGLRHAWDPDGESRGRVVATLVGGVTAGLGTTVGAVVGSPPAGYGLVDSLSGLAVGGLVGAVLLVLIVPGLYSRTVGTRSSGALALGAMVGGAVAVAAVSRGSLAPILAVGAALVCWDALRLDHELRTEVPGAASLSVERRHLGSTASVAVVGVGAAVAVAVGADALGPSIAGEPLVVVVAGAAVLAGVLVVLARAEGSRA